MALSKKKLIPLLMFSAGLIFLFILETTRSDAEFDRNTFRQSSNFSSESAVGVGGDRPADLFLPSSYTEETPVPLLINLHGYTGDSQSQSTYTFLQSAAETRGVAYLAPEGLKDSAGSRFCNAKYSFFKFGC